MSKVQVSPVSAQGKKFKEYYEVGNLWLPKIAQSLYIIRELRQWNQITLREVQDLFEEESYFISAQSEAFDERSLSIGKDRSMYVCLNRGLSIVPFKPLPLHAIVKSSTDSNYVSYVTWRPYTPITALIKYDSTELKLPKGLDIMNLPDESMFQTEMYIDSRLVNGAAVWMGLRDAEYELAEMVFYGQSLLKVKRAYKAMRNVIDKIRVKYKT